jgi:hypothetical protein
MSDLVYPALAQLFGTRACPPAAQEKYNRALPETVPLWNAFLAENLDFCDVYWYGVKCGEHYPLTGEEDEITRGIAKSLYSRWIDAVGFDGYSWWIFGIQPDMGTGAIGDVVSYKVLFADYYKTTRPVKGAIVTDYADPVIMKAVRAQGIEKVFVIPRPGFPP